MGNAVPIEFARAMKNPALRYRLRRIEATSDYFGDLTNPRFGELARRSAEPVNGKNPWHGNVWDGLFRLEALIAEEIGPERLSGPVSEDDVDPVFRWWMGRMNAAATYFGRDSDSDKEEKRLLALVWALEEVKRRDGEEVPMAHWKVLEVLEERVLGEIRRKPKKARNPRARRAAAGGS